MSELRDKELRAAEYILGTLPDAERQQVAADRLSDTELDGYIHEWQQRLEPLLATISEATPREELLAKIEAQLPVNTVSDSASVENIFSLRKQIQRWRNIAIATSSLAASLAAFILFAPADSHLAEPFVAVFQQDDQQPAFLMSVNLETQQLTVRPITATGQLGKSYQLWIKADLLGDKPRSLGLLESLDQPTLKRVDFDSEVLQNALFGISVEPEGGSPTGQPTGPAIHGRLYPASI